MQKSQSLVLSVIVLLCVASSVQAVTCIVRSDRDLVRRADAIIIGTAVESHSELTDIGGVVTVAEMQIEGVLKGTISDDSVRLVEPGGMMSERAMLIPGSPRYESGKRYLIFLRMLANGDWTTYVFKSANSSSPMICVVAPS